MSPKSTKKQPTKKTHTQTQTKKTIHHTHKTPKTPNPTKQDAPTKTQEPDGRYERQK